MNDKNLYIAIIRNAEALGGKNISHYAVLQYVLANTYS